jgi:hypothetical protein
MEHSRQSYGTHVRRRPRDDWRDRPHADRLPDHLVGARRLRRRIAGDRDPEEPLEAPRHRDRQVQLLPGDEVAVAHLLAAARDDAVRDREARHRNAELGRGEAEQRLVDVGADLARVRVAAAHVTGREAAVRRAVGVAHHDLGDGRVGDAQLLGEDLRVRRARRALTELDLARAHQDRVVGVDLEPRARKRRVERRASRGLGRLRTDSRGADHAEPDDESAAALDELLTRERGAEDVSDLLFHRAHVRLPSP